jgi:hypothetical protein
MAQPADGLTMEKAHTKIKTQITEIEGFIQRHKMVGSLGSEQRAEAGALRRKLEHRLSYLKILWYAEPNKVRFEELSNWITDVGDEVRRTLNVMEVFMKVREMRLLTEHDAGVKTITDPAGVDVVLQSTEATTNTQKGLNNDTVEMRETLTPRAGDREEPRFTLRPKDMSELIAIPTGQFNPRFDELVDHPGGAGAVIGKQGKKLKVQTGRRYLPRLMDIRITGMQVAEDNRQLASCWPLMGRCASCGIEGHRRLRAPCIAQGRRCNDCGSEGHLACVCTTKKNLYTKRNRGHAKQKGKMPASRGCLTRGAGVHAQETSKKQKTRSLESFGNNNNQTTGVQILSEGNDMTTRGATSHQESASRDRSTGGYAVGNVVSHRPRVKETGRGGLDIGA